MHKKKTFPTWDTPTRIQVCERLVFDLGEAVELDVVGNRELFEHDGNLPGVGPGRWAR